MKQKYEKGHTRQTNFKKLGLVITANTIIKENRGNDTRFNSVSRYKTLKFACLRKANFVFCPCPPAPTSAKKTIKTTMFLRDSQLRMATLVEEASICQTSQLDGYKMNWKMF